MAQRIAPGSTPTQIVRADEVRVGDVLAAPMLDGTFRTWDVLDVERNEHRTNLHTSRSGRSIRDHAEPTRILARETIHADQLDIGDRFRHENGEEVYEVARVEWHGTGSVKAIVTTTPHGTNPSGRVWFGAHSHVVRVAS